MAAHPFSALKSSGAFVSIHGGTALYEIHDLAFTSNILQSLELCLVIIYRIRSHTYPVGFFTWQVSNFLHRCFTQDNEMLLGNLVCLSLLYVLPQCAGKQTTYTKTKLISFFPHWCHLRSSIIQAVKKTSSSTLLWTRLEIDVKNDSGTIMCQSSKRRIPTLLMSFLLLAKWMLSTWVIC